MSDFARKRILVIGGAGFIGSHLVDALLSRGAVLVAVVDNFFLGNEENLADARHNHGDRLTIFREDASEATAMKAILDRVQPDIVFNLATKALLYSFFNPAGACRVNLDIAIVLAEFQRAGIFGRLVHFSSSEVYGTAIQVPMDERHPLLAETSYAAGKAAADLLLRSYINMFDQDIVIVRPFNNYGPRQNDGDLAAVVPLTIRRLQRGERPIIHGDGRQTRDFIFVLDTVAAALTLALRPETKGEIYNVASGRETSIADIVRIICKLMQRPFDPVFDNRRPADVLRHWGGIERVRAVLGEVAPTSIEDGLAATIAWYVR